MSVSEVELDHKSRDARAGERQADVVTIERLVDPVVDDIGVPVTSRYCEVFWLPILGPSAMWMLRHCAYHTAGGPYVVDVDTLARSLGLGGGTGVHGPVRRTLTRLIAFHCASGGVNRYAVRSSLGPVPRSALGRLPESLRAAHAAFVAGEGAL